MPTLLLRFPGGRYHATPPGHHVNEGLVEWPPSPWRLLRAFLACGYATQRWTHVPAPARRLLEALAGTLPHYRLPPASVAHSRHYMPLGVLERGREKTTLVFDSWADVGDGRLAVRWPCEVDEEALAVFCALATHLGYLGRSESWVVGEAISDGAELPAGFSAHPHVEGDRRRLGSEQVSLMAPDVPASYSAWREEEVAGALAAFPLPAGKKPSKKLEKDRARAVEAYPIDLLDCLGRDTAWWKQRRWSQPPGSRRVLYWRQDEALVVGAPAPAPRRASAPVEAMLLAITAASGARGALPTRSRALPQAELLHRSLVSHLSRDGRVPCPELIGKDEQGELLKGHQHAHLMPVDLDDDGHLDHFIVYAPMKLGPVAQDAIQSVKRTWTKRRAGELRVAIAGRGSLESLRSLPSPFAAGIARVLGPSCTWESFTPLVLPRFRKARGKSSLEGQVQAELSERGFPPAGIELLPWDGATLALRHAVRVRSRGGRPPPVDAGYAVRLHFEEPVFGPVSLGYASHFGLGLFLAAPQAERT